MDTSSIPGLELIQVADVVAREKSIEREEVMVAMEEAIQKAGRARWLTSAPNCGGAQCPTRALRLAPST